MKLSLSPIDLLLQQRGVRLPGHSSQLRVRNDAIVGMGFTQVYTAFMILGNVANNAYSAYGTGVFLPPSPA